MWYRFGYTLAWLYFHLLYRLKVIGMERIEQSWSKGGVLLACNHGSYYDPPIVGVFYRKRVTFLARKTLFVGLYGFFYTRFNAIPVDQERPDFTSLKRIIKDLREGKPVLIFPEGERTETGELLTGKPGVGLVIAKAKVPVLPMRITGAFEAFPRKAKWPKLFRRLTLTVGDMIEFDEDELSAKGREGYQALADRVMDEIAAIPKPE